MHTLRYKVTIVAALAAMIALVPLPGVAGAAGHAPDCDPPPTPAVGATELASGTSMTRGEEISSPNGNQVLRFEDSGQLTFSQGGKVVWIAGTKGTDIARVGTVGDRVAMQSNGNLVLSRQLSKIRAVLWESGTAGSSGASLWVQDDGRAVIRAKDSGSELWSIGSVHEMPNYPPVPSAVELYPTEKLVPGEYVDSPNGDHRLMLYADGNLTLRSRGTTVWDSGTAGEGDVAELQRDGNLVIRTGGTLEAVWNSETDGSPGAVLRVQDDGRVVIREAMWDLSPGKPPMIVGYGKELWAVGAPIVRYNSLGPDTVLDPGDSAYSPDGCQRLTLQPNGNLELRRWTDKAQSYNVLLWESRTAYSRAGDYYARTELLIMQRDGNLVQYQVVSGHPTRFSAIWHAGTHGNAGAFLAIQNDGRIAIRGADGSELWSAGMEKGSELWSMRVPVGDASILYWPAD